MLNINFDYDCLIGEGVNYMTHTSIIFNGENTFVIPFEYRRLLVAARTKRMLGRLVSEFPPSTCMTKLNSLFTTAEFKVTVITKADITAKFG